MKLAWLLHVYKHGIFHLKFFLADILYSLFKVGTVISRFLLFWGESVEAVVILLLYVTVFCVELIIEFEGAWWEGRNWRMMLGYFSESHEGHIKNLYHDDWGFPDGDSVIEPACQCRRLRDRHGFDPWIWKNPWGRARKPTPILLSGEFHGQSSLVGSGP